jgi:hypothetical protein
MLARVLVLGRVAAPHMTAGKAHPQVDPRVAYGETLLAPLGIGGHVMYLVEMFALGGHALRLFPEHVEQERPLLRLIKLHEDQSLPPAE